MAYPIEYYTIQTEWSDDDEQFLATNPELPGLSAFGDTEEEAIECALEIAEDMVKIKKKYEK